MVRSPLSRSITRVLAVAAVAGATLTAVPAFAKPGDYRQQCGWVSYGAWSKWQCWWEVCAAPGTGVALPSDSIFQRFDRPEPVCVWEWAPPPGTVDTTYCCQGQYRRADGRTVYTGCSKVFDPAKAKRQGNFCGSGKNWLRVIEVTCNNYSEWDSDNGNLHECY